MELSDVNQAGVVYLTPNEQNNGTKGVKVYKDGRWEDVKSISQLAPGNKVSIDGIVYTVTTSKTDYTITFLKKYKLESGAIVYELPGDKYYVVDKDKQYTISKSRFQNMVKGVVSEVEIRIAPAILEYNKTVERKQPSSKPIQTEQPRTSEQATRQDGHKRTDEQLPRQSQQQLDTKALLTHSSLITTSQIYIRDEVYYNTSLRQVWDELDRVTGGIYRTTMSKATGLSLDQLKQLEKYTLVDILALRRELESFLKSPNSKELDALINKYGDVAVTFMLRTLTGDRELDVKTLEQAMDYVKSNEYGERVRHLTSISINVERLLEQKSLLERYYFVKYVYDALMNNINGMEYIEGGQVKTINLNNPGNKEKELVERLLGNFNNPYLSYKYGLPFLAKTTGSFDNLVASLEIVERVMLGINNSTDSLGLNRLEQYRYYSEELPRIIAGLYQNYANAVSNLIGRRITADFGNFVSSSPGLGFHELMTVGDIISDFVKRGKNVDIPPDAAFGTRGSTRASPTLTVPDPDLITQGILMNTSQLATRYNRAGGYFFKLPSNTWEQLRANVYVESTERSHTGSGTFELIGTRSMIIGKVDNDEISFIGRNLELLNAVLQGNLKISPNRVSGELEAELDRRFGGANVGVVFKHEKDKFNGILYAKINGNWYQLGYVDNAWVAGMDVLIPGFAAMVGNVKVGEGGIVGSIGIAMQELSAYVLKNEQDLIAIAAYLLNGNQLAAGSFLGKQVTAPNIVYGGIYNGNIVTGGQYLSKDTVVSGFGIIGNGVGLRLSVGTSNFAMTGSYLDLGGLSQIAAGVKTRLNSYNLFALYASRGDEVLMGGGLHNNDMSLQLFRMSRAKPEIFGSYSGFFQGVQGVTGAYVTFGRTYLEGILGDDLRMLFGAGIRVEDVEVQGAVGIGNGTMVAARTSFPLGVYLVSLGLLYDQNKPLFAASAQNNNWFFGAAYNQDKLYLKTRYRDEDRTIEVYGNLGSETGILGKYVFLLDQKIFANITAGVSNNNGVLGWYIGGGVRNDNLDINVGYGREGESYRLRLSARAVFNIQ